MARENRPNSLWPPKTTVAFCDAWGRNPVNGIVVRHYGEFNVLVEDSRGVRHFGQTWRIETPPLAKRPIVDLDDLIGSSPTDLLDDLLV